MKTKNQKKPLVAAVSTIFATGMLGATAANAEQNPFEMTELSSGYMVAGKEGSCGEGKCGEGKCGEGKCGSKKAVKMMDKNGDGNISWMEWDRAFATMDKNNDGKLTHSEMEGKCGEGNCGEGKCGEGKCGESKGKAEGSCGEGKCGEGKCGN